MSKAEKTTNVITMSEDTFDQKVNPALSEHDIGVAEGFAIGVSEARKDGQKYGRSTFRALSRGSLASLDPRQRAKAILRMAERLGVKVG